MTEDQSPPESAEADATPRRPQFNLRTLLFVLLFCGLICGGYGYRFYRERVVSAQQQQAMGELRDAYGATGELRGPYVVSLSFPPARFNQGALDSLQRFPQLERIVLIGAPITASTLANLSKVANLRELILMETPIDDSMLKEIAKLKLLRKLWLSDTKVTDLGMRELAKLTNLRRLDLSNTRLSDVGLRQLHDLQELTELYLFGTRVTRAGAKEFQRVNGQCKVVLGDDRP